MTDHHALPLHVQISEMLIRDIQAGRLSDGERLPPERAMAEHLGISVGTLRKALGDLSQKGLLERVQGSGNYVRAQTDVKSVYAFFRVELLEGGGLPTAEILSIHRRIKDPQLPDFGAGPEGFCIRRLRSLSGKPAVLEEIWLDGSFAQTIAEKDLRESLYLYYREKLGLWITSAEDRVGMDVVPDWAPAGYGLRPGASTVCVTRISRGQDGTAAEVSRNWIDTNVATYVSRLS